jgi:hypothetical protein
MAVLLEIKVADEVWIATALLHRENPSRNDFTVKEIEARATREKVVDDQRPGVYVHANLHCVANREPKPNAYRMLYETRAGYRRLFREGDDYHPARKRGKTKPKPDEIPPCYADLLQWYEEWSKKGSLHQHPLEKLLALRGSGKHIWADEHADEYVSRLREGWE